MSGTPDRAFAATFITPNQHLSSGGGYAIQRFAQACSPLMRVSLIVQDAEPEPLPGVATYPGTVLERGQVPPGDVLIVPADDARGEEFLELPNLAGRAVLLFQGYGTPGNPVVVANLEAYERALATATWLVDEALAAGCEAEFVRLGFERSAFFPGPPTSERAPSVVMMTSHIDWKGTDDGLEAIRLARAEIPELQVELFGHRDPGLPEMCFSSTPSRALVAEIMRRSTVLVCPSWEEGFGMPCVEAMLCGTAVATTDTKGSRDYAIPELTALVTEPRDPVALAESIVRLIRDASLRARCVSRARQLVDGTYGDWPDAAVLFAASLQRLAAGRATYRPSGVGGHRSSRMTYHRRMDEALNEGTTQAGGSDNGVGDGARYDFEIDPDSNTTHAHVVRLVGSDRRVLELGPATGYMSRALRARGCSVVGIEVDRQMADEASRYAERIVVGDLDTLDLDEELGSERFDVIVAADVLEHLKDPLGALRRLREFLAPGGFFVISLPNIAHGSVRLALLEGHFDYQKLGLLDRTHLRFFTRESIEQMLDEADLAVAEIVHQELNIEASEVRFDSEAVSPALMQQLSRDPDARTYQFILKALPVESPGLRELQRQMRELSGQVHDLTRERDQVSAENARLVAENAQLREPDPRLQELQQSLAAIAAREGQLRASLIDAHDQLFQRDLQLNQLREELLPLRKQFDRLRASPLGRLYLKLRRVRRAASALNRRAERYRAVLRKL